ncbi:uncharacterized protein LOC121870980 [Homarus americanus]|nr:uncharacterized protein LOC121870980 [Homarus americanus]XP_042228914.1 uncharacterized protein LOC121870980 [Homarus americanus]
MVTEIVMMVMLGVVMVSANVPAEKTDLHDLYLPDCGEITKMAPGETAIINSHLPTEDHPDEHKCVWKFVCKEINDNYIRVECLYFDLTSAANCGDKLVMRKYKRSPKTKFCGTDGPHGVENNQGWMKLTYTSDAVDDEHSGFQCYVKCLAK